MRWDIERGRGAVRLTVAVSGRSRWRWLRLELGALRGRWRVQTIAVQTWLTDASMRGNLRRKSFIRFKVGLGGDYEPGERGCPWRDSRGRPCTWERGHAPMVIGFRNTRTGQVIEGRSSTRSHSWAVAGRLPRNAVVLVEPRRRNARSVASGGGGR